MGAVKGWDLAIEESGYLVMCSLANSECGGSPPGSGELSVTAESAHHLSSLSMKKNRQAGGVSVGKVQKGFWRHTEPSTDVSKQIHHSQ